MHGSSSYGYFTKNLLKWNKSAAMPTFTEFNTLLIQNVFEKFVVATIPRYSNMYMYFLLQYHSDIIFVPSRVTTAKELQEISQASCVAFSDLPGTHGDDITVHRYWDNTAIF